eukprot:173372-Amphidinium_carterae.1
MHLGGIALSLRKRPGNMLKFNKKWQEMSETNSIRLASLLQEASNNEMGINLEASRAKMDE